MKPQVKRLYQGAKGNKEFIGDFESTGDKVPGPFIDNDTAIMFGLMYYGWLMGKYGRSWESHI